jgi:hypothetical protein
MRRPLKHHPAQNDPIRAAMVYTATIEKKKNATHNQKSHLHTIIKTPSSSHLTLLLATTLPYLIHRSFSAIPPCSSQCSIKPHTPQRPSPPNPRHQRLSASIRQLIRPFPETRLHIPRHSFKYNRTYRYKRAIFHPGGNDTVVLCEEESGCKGVGLRLREGPNDTVTSISMGAVEQGEETRHTCKLQRKHPERRFSPHPHPSA